MINEKEHISHLIRTFIEEIIHPYRELNVQMSEQWMQAGRDGFDYSGVIHGLLHLKKAAEELARDSDKTDVQPEQQALFNKCVTLFITAVEQQIQTLRTLGYQAAQTTGAAAQEQDQSQRYLASMSKNLTALKQSLKK